MTTDTSTDLSQPPEEPTDNAPRETPPVPRTEAQYRQARMRLLANIAAKHRKQPRKPTSDLGFHFTPEENYSIHLAKRHAAQFMETYGKDAPRANQKQIDLTHYLQ